MSAEQNFLLANRCSGGEKCKVRLTGMVAATTTCKKLPMIVIGKSKKPPFFNNVKQLPCWHGNRQNTWMRE